MLLVSRDSLVDQDTYHIVNHIAGYPCNNWVVKPPLKNRLNHGWVEIFPQKNKKQQETTS